MKFFPHLLLCLIPYFSFAQTDSIPAPTEEINTAAYGGKTSMGVAIFNGFGVPVRYYPNARNAFEIGANVGTLILIGNKEIQDIQLGLMPSVGFTHFAPRRLKRERVRAGGISLRYSYLFTKDKAQIVAVSWATEIFKTKRKSFLYEIGGKVVSVHYKYGGNDTQFSPYVRIMWNFYNKKA